KGNTPFYTLPTTYGIIIAYTYIISNSRLQCCCYLGLVIGTGIVVVKSSTCVTFLRYYTSTLVIYIQLGIACITQCTSTNYIQTTGIGCKSIPGFRVRRSKSIYAG